MKKVFLFLMMLLSCTVMYADEVVMESDGNDIKAEEMGPHKAPPLLPQVFIDGEELSVLSPYVSDPAQIIIRDVNDDIIYNVYVILPASTYMMILPDEVNALKYKIELIYGDHHLVGFF